MVFPTIKNGDTGITHISGLLGFFTPMVKVDKSSLIFRAEYGNGSSDVQSFNVSTLGILPDNPIVTAPPNFEVSLNNVNFSDSLGILKNTEQTVYVRLKATAPYGEYNGTLRIWTYNSVTVEQTVSLSGVVMKAAQPSVSSLPSFTTAYPDGSNSQSFTLSSYGLNMPTTITAPANFEVSLNNVNFLGSVSSSGDSLTVYVRLLASVQAGTVSGSVTISSVGDARTVAVSATVSPGYLVSRESLAAITAAYGQGGSSAEHFTINGSGLSGLITVTAPANFEVSMDNIHFFGSVSPADSSAMIFVRSVATAPVGTFSGNVTIAGSGSAQKTVAVSATVAPGVSLSVEDLAAFSYEYGSGPSSAQSFTVSSAGLSEVLTVTAPANFEVSSDNVNFSGSVVIPAGGSSVIHVRLAASAPVGMFSGSVTIGSSEIADKTVAVSATVPTIIPLGVSLARFQTTAGTVSVSQSITLDGALFTDSAHIAAPAGYEVSTDDITFGASVAVGSGELGSIYSNGSAFAALKRDGSVETWGSAANGGDSGFSSATVTAAPAGSLSSGVTAIYPSSAAFAALKSDGSVVTWGASWAGGDSSTTYGGSLSGVTAISSNGRAFAALTSNGSVVTWGSISYGGDSGFSSPTVTAAPAGSLSSGVTAIYSMGYAFAALKSDGSVVTWGQTSTGGDPSFSSATMTAAPAGSLSSGVTAIYSTGYNSSSPDGYAFVALKSDSSVVVWGNKYLGGDPSYSSDIVSPAPVGSLSFGVTAIYSSGEAFAALKGDGSVVTWGAYRAGGDSGYAKLTQYNANYTTITVAAPAGSLSSGVTAICSFSSGLGGTFAALKDDGSVVYWGDASWGVDYSMIYGGSLSSGVTAIYSNGGAFAALKSDGSVVTWGSPASGANPSFSSPAAAAGSLSSGVTGIYPNGGVFAALKSDGSVVTWPGGDNPVVSLPGGDSSAVVSELAGVTAIYPYGSGYAALKGDGSVVTWGLQAGVTAIYLTGPPTLPAAVYVRVAANAEVGLPNGDLTITSIGLTPQTVALSATILQQPTVTSAPTELSGLTTIIGTPSAVQTITVSGTALSGEITVTTTADFEISLDGNTFGAALTIPQSGGLASVTVYVRTTAVATATAPIGLLDGSLALSSSLAVTKTVPVSVMVMGQITSSVGSLSGFQSIGGTTASDAQSFTLDGIGLSAPAYLTAPVGYEVSTDGTTFGSSIAFKQGVAGTSSVRTIVANSSAYAALLANGSVVTWGYREGGGDPDFSRPISFNGAKTVTAAPAGSLSSGVTEIYAMTGNSMAFAALKEDGSVVTWGRSLTGGDSSTTYGGSLSSGVIAIYPGNGHAAALKSDGSVVTWGNNLTLGYYLPKTFPADPSYSSTTLSHEVKAAPEGSLSSGVVAIYMGSANAALKEDGSVVTWGSGSAANFVSYSGRGGYGDLSSGVTAIFYDRRNSHSPYLALKDDGSVVTWWNSNPYYSSVSSGVVTAPWGPPPSLGSGVTGIYASSGSGQGAPHAALKEDGSVVTWGYRTKGGDPSYSSTTLYEEVIAAPVGSLNSGVTAIVTGVGSFAALKDDGSVVIWGSIPSTQFYFAPEGSLNSGVTAIYTNGYAFAALKDDGSVVTWGSRYKGGVGASEAFDLDEALLQYGEAAKLMAAPAGSLSSGVTAIYTGNHLSLAALKEDGSVVTWGGGRGADSSAVASDLRSGVQAIFNAGDSYAALKIDGSVVHWGNEENIAIGLVNGNYTGVPEIISPGQSLPATIYVRLAANAQQGQSNGDLTITSDGVVGQTVALSGSVTPGQNSIASWRLAYFGSAENTGDFANLATPDGDGIPNITKYALCIPPGANGTAGLPRPAMQSDEPSGTRLALSFRRDPSRTDVTLIVEAQSGGFSGEWTIIARSDAGGAITGAAETLETDNPDGTRTVVVSDTLAVDSAIAVQRFMRIRVISE